MKTVNAQIPRTPVASTAEASRPTRSPLPERVRTELLQNRINLSEAAEQLELSLDETEKLLGPLYSSESWDA